MGNEMFHSVIASVARIRRRRCSPSRPGWLRRAVAAIVLGGSAFFAWAQTGSPELTILHFERMPYFGVESGRSAGLLVDVSGLIFAEAKIPVRYQVLPVRRIFAMLAEPVNACTLGALKTEAREKTYAYSDDFIYQDQPFTVILNAKHRHRFSKEPTVREVLESPLRPGVIDGYAYGEWLDRNLAQYQPTLSRINIGDDTARLFRMIVADRVDYMFAVVEEADYVLRRHPEFARDLVKVPLADAPAGNKRYLLCSKGIDKDLMRRINVAIARVKTSSEYGSVITRR